MKQPAVQPHSRHRIDTAVLATVDSKQLADAQGKGKVGKLKIIERSKTRSTVELVDEAAYAALVRKLPSMTRA